MRDERKSKARLPAEPDETRGRNAELETALRRAEEDRRQLRDHALDLERKEKLERETHLFAESIVQTVREPLLVLDDELRVKMANRSFCETFHVPPEETEDRLLHELGDRQWDIPALRTLLEDVVSKDAQFQDFEVEHDFPIIGHRTMLLNAQQIRWDGGTMPFVLLAIEDITERVTAEEALRQAKEQLTAILESISDAFFALDENMVVTYFNSAAQQMLGRKAEDVVGRPLFEAFREAKGSVFEENYARALREKTPLAFDAYLAAKPHENWYDVRVYPQKNGISVYFRVTTERKRAEEALRRSEEKYRVLFHAANDAVFLHGFTPEGAPGRFLEVNDAACRRLGYSREQLLEMTPTDIDDPEWRAEAESVRREVRAREEVTFEMVHVARDGQRIPVEISSRLFALGDDTVALSVARDITERKRAEEALRKSEERYRRIVETANEGIWIVDDQSNTAFANARMAQMLGFTGEEMLGRPMFAFMDEEWRGRAEANEERRRLGCAEAHEFKFRRKDGSALWAIVAATPIFEGERYAGALGMITDITERKQAEEALRGSEEHYRLLFETMLSGVVYQEADGRIVSMNPAAERILGKSHEEFLGQTSVSVEHHTIRADGTPFPGLEHPSMVALATGKEVRDVVMGVFNPREQGYRWISITAVPLFREAEVKPYRVYTLFADITERKRAEAELRRMLAANEQLALAHLRERELSDATVSSIAEGVLVYDGRGTLTRMNDAAQEILGAAEDLCGLSMAEARALLGLETPEGRQVAVEDLPSARALRGETVRGRLLVAHRLDEGRVWVSASAAPIPSPTGEIAGAVVTFTDITVLRELQEQREDILRMVSHDLRNPLTAVQGGIQILIRYLQKAGEVGPMLRTAEGVLTSTRRMNVMIQDLVDSLRLESGQFDLRRQPVDLMALTSGLLARTGEAMDVERVKAEIPRDLPPVEADPDRLERIMTNLISNALKYSPPESAVLVTAERRDGEARISVADRGRGISPEDQLHIFERFYQAKGVRRGGGLGLGLYIARMLVEAHGGRIWVESVVDRGTTFTFTLPLAD